MAKDANDEQAEPAAEEKKTEKKQEKPKNETKPALAQKKAEPAAPAKNVTKPAAKAAPKNETKTALAKKTVKSEEEEIPMDTAAIKAYSSVIADAAEDSEPQQPVQYTEVIQEEERPKHESLSLDPMGSMIQNEISSIKEASIKAAQDAADEWIEKNGWLRQRLTIAAYLVLTIYI